VVVGSLRQPFQRSEFCTLSTVSKRFYDTEFAGVEYARQVGPEEHPFFPVLTRFIRQLGLAGTRCLEIGCGRGCLQDVVADYTGFDLSDSVRAYLHKPFVQGNADRLPFPDRSFDTIWSYAALEHIPQPELALSEMRRVLRNGGVLLLSPAWQCRPWAASGLAVRPYHGLTLRMKVAKALIPVRESVLLRALSVLPQRPWRWLGYLAVRRPTSFRYRTLTPNYERYLCADSDAVSQMDPHEAILWFTSRGDECLSHPGTLRRLFVRTGCLAFRIREGGAASVSS
jgi:SAM-dependent methyltransferase